MRITIRKDDAGKIGLDPLREQTNNEGNIVLERETYWADCTIYEDLKDAAVCMARQIPQLAPGSIEDTLNVIESLQKQGVTKFYQAVRYFGFWSPFDTKNCCSLCLLCKQGLVAFKKDYGDAPIPYVLAHLSGSSHDTAIILVTCFTCRTRTYREIPGDLIMREISSIIFSDDTRWLKNSRLIESPYKRI